MTRGNKQVASISIKNTTYYIDLLFVNAIALKKLQTTTSYDNLNKVQQEQVRELIRKLVIKKDNISTQIIENEIFMQFLSKDFKNKLLSLDK